MAYGVDIPDMDALIRRVGSLPAKAKRKGFTDANRAAARVSRKEARATTAFVDKTGLLRSKIKVRTRRGRVELAAEAPHAHLIELGHGGPQPAPPHPFMEPAIRNTVSRQLEAAAKAFRTFLAKLGEKR